MEEEASAQTAGEETSEQVSEEGPSGAIQEEEVLNADEPIQGAIPVQEVRIHSIFRMTSWPPQM